MSLPAWVYDLLISVQRYEDQHGSHEDGWKCFDSFLDDVPVDELDKAKAISAYLGEKWPEVTG